MYCYCFHTLHDVHINRTECCRDDYSALVFVSPRCGIVQSAYDGSLYWYGAAMVMRNSHRILMICSRGERCIQWANARSNRPTLVWGSHHVSLLRLLLFLFCHLCCCGWKAILFVHQPSSTSHQLQPLLSLPLPCNIRFEAFVLSWLLNGFYRPQLHSTSCAAAFFRPFSMSAEVFNPAAAWAIDLGHFSVRLQARKTSLASGLKHQRWHHKTA